MEKEDNVALFELERQRGVIRDRVRDVALGRHTSAYVYGRAGIGNTHLVRATLDDRWRRLPPAHPRAA